MSSEYRHRKRPPLPWAHPGLDKLIRSRVAAGALYVGCSAGAIVAGRSAATALWKGWDDPRAQALRADPLLRGRECFASCDEPQQIYLLGTTFDSDFFPVRIAPQQDAEGLATCAGAQRKPSP